MLQLRRRETIILIDRSINQQAAFTLSLDRHGVGGCGGWVGDQDDRMDRVAHDHQGGEQRHRPAQLRPRSPAAQPGGMSMEHMTSMPYLDKWVQSLRSAFYDAEDIVDIHDYLNLALHMQLCRFGCKPNQVTFFSPF